MKYVSYTEMAGAVGLALFLMLVLLFFVAFGVAFLKPTHRFHRILTPLVRRLASTCGIIFFNKAIDGFPDLALPYNFAATAFLCWYWWGFISQHLLAPDAQARQRDAMDAADHAVKNVEPTY